MIAPPKAIAAATTLALLLAKVTPQCATPLEITEIMFNPQSQPTPSEYQWEFIEVYNPSTSPVNMAGFVLWDDDETGALQSRTTANIPSGTIPGKSRAVLVNSVGAKDFNFAQAWGINPSVVIPWEGPYPQLANSGDVVYIYNSLAAAKAAGGSSKGACAALPAGLTPAPEGLSLQKDCSGAWQRATFFGSVLKDVYGNQGTPGQGPSCNGDVATPTPTPTPTPITITTPTSTNFTVPSTACASIGTPIHKIQGRAHWSPMTSDYAVVTGIVTGKRSYGFFLQTPDGADDGIDETSEGLFIYTDDKPAVEVGQVVQVGGKVTEYTRGKLAESLTFTQIVVAGEANAYVTTCPDLYKGTKVSAVDLSRDGRLPPDRYIYRPKDCERIDINQLCDDGACPELNLEFGLDYWESLEGMLVRLPKPVLSANSYDGIWVLGNEGKDSTSTTTQNTALLSVQGPVVECDSDFNPEAILLATGVEGKAGFKAKMSGATVGSIAQQDFVEGVLEYRSASSFNSDAYQINILTDVTWKAGVKPYVTVAKPRGAKQLNIAGYNVLNLSPEDTQQSNLLGAQITANLGCPQLVTLIEVQDNDGATNTATVDASQTYKMLIDSVKSNSADCQYAYVDINPEDDQEGGEPGGNIRVGYLYNPSWLKVKTASGAGGSAEECEIDAVNGRLKRNPCRLGTKSVAFDATRNPLVVEWEVKNGVLCQGDNSIKECGKSVGGEVSTTPLSFITIGVHSSSKGGSTSLYGATQPYINYNSEKRTAQHQLIADFVKALISKNKDRLVVVLGDFNEFSGFPAMQVLDQKFGGPLHNVADTFVPPGDRASYVFGANSQSLDHILVSKLTYATQAQMLRINSPIDKKYQVSDHDALVVTLSAGGDETCDGTCEA